jgi:hypothetical protein
VRAAREFGQVGGGRRNRVLGVIDVCDAVVVAVDAVAPPRGQRPVARVELHRASAAAVAVEPRVHAGRVRAAVVGLDRADRGEHGPRHPGPIGGLAVQAQVAAGDGPLGVAARVRLECAARAAVARGDDREHSAEGGHANHGEGGDRSDCQRRGWFETLRHHAQVWRSRRARYARRRERRLPDGLVAGVQARRQFAQRDGRGVSRDRAGRIPADSRAAAGCLPSARHGGSCAAGGDVARAAGAGTARERRAEGQADVAGAGAAGHHGRRARSARALRWTSA